MPTPTPTPRQMGFLRSLFSAARAAGRTGVAVGRFATKTPRRRWLATGLGLGAYGGWKTRSKLNVMAGQVLFPGSGPRKQ